MTKLRFTMQTLALAAFMLALTSIAQAQATRTFVSGVGDDVNPCSRTAPCKTFAGAISKTATGGEINVLDPGGFGAVTITKHLTIDGGGNYASILACGFNGVIVNDSQTVAPNTIKVTIRRLSINGCGDTTSPGSNGIRFISGAAVNVEDCYIFGFRTGTGHGIDVSLTAGTNQQLTVKDTNIYNNLGSGVRANHSAGTVRIHLNNVRSERNTNGVLVENGVAAVLVNSQFTHNTSDGVSVNQAAGNASANIDNCVMTQNGGAGLRTTGPVTARISGNYIVGNIGTGVTVGSANSVQSFGDNEIKANTTDVSGTLISVPAPVKQ